MVLITYQDSRNTFSHRLKQKSDCEHFDYQWHPNNRQDEYELMHQVLYVVLVFVWMFLVILWNNGLRVTALPVVPNHNLAAVGSTNQKVRMISKAILSFFYHRWNRNSLSKLRFCYSRLTLEYVFWCFLGEFSIPYKSNTIWINVGCAVLTIWCGYKFWKLNAM